ncbi:hypothetical protein BJY24_001636 [Nocardia transvalensis]|uniref:Lipoprotein n=1 Tax=Nocardia transvalensis TaxID=37333 RepID=A0A7W9UGX9_9NOCA|nr:hypothetical protein [Nocardia transvalensis]MBB5912769.1 hypothetical protein [Nocardia transvalensis]
MKNAVAALAIGALLTSAGCGLLDGSDDGDAGAGCTTTFDLSPVKENLGPRVGFKEKAAQAAEASAPTTLIAITTAAGWSGDWDRMVDIPQNTRADQIDALAGTSGVCWKNAPKPRSADGDGPHRGYYLFLKGDQPRQTIDWSGNFDQVFAVDKGTVLTPDTTLTPVPGPHPQLRPT